MADTLTDKLSRPVKAVTDYAKNLYTQGKALVAPLDNEKAAINAKQANVDAYRKANPSNSGSGSSANDSKAQPSSYKKGGKVRKTGKAKVHKGERVLTVKQTKKFDKKGGFKKLFGNKDGDE